MSSTTKPCGKISRRIEGSQLDLDQAPGIGQNDDVIEQQRIAAVHESAVGPFETFERCRECPFVGADRKWPAPDRNDAFDP
jgi:hypothetical protein